MSRKRGSFVRGELCALAGIRHVGTTTAWLAQQLQVARYGGAHIDQTEEQRRHNQAVDRVLRALSREPDVETPA